MEHEVPPPEVGVRRCSHHQTVAVVFDDTVGAGNDELRSETERTKLPHRACSVIYFEGAAHCVEQLVLPQLSMAAFLAAACGAAVSQTLMHESYCAWLCADCSHLPAHSANCLA